MHINDMKTSKYLRKTDIDMDAGSTFTITRLAQENVAREDEAPDEKYIIYFRETPKGMVLNSTNIQLIALAVKSEETDTWPGKRIKLYYDPSISFGGRLVGGIRVFVPNAAKSALAHDELNPPPNDEPF